MQRGATMKFFHLKLKIEFPHMWMAIGSPQKMLKNHLEGIAPAAIWAFVILAKKYQINTPYNRFKENEFKFRKTVNSFAITCFDMFFVKHTSIYFDLTSI